MMIEAFEPTPEEMMVHRIIDHRLTTEGLILAGLAEAVRSGWLTEDEKSAWLDDYISTRNETS
jgi:hypothetical protein